MKTKHWIILVIGLFFVVSFAASIRQWFFSTLDTSTAPPSFANVLWRVFAWNLTILLPLALLAFWLATFIHALTNKELEPKKRALWALAILFLNLPAFLGTLLYYFLIRKRLAGWKAVSAILGVYIGVIVLIIILLGLALLGLSRTRKQLEKEFEQQFVPALSPSPSASAGSSAPPSLAPAPSRWEVFSSELGYSISYPAGWQYVEATRDLENNIQTLEFVPAGYIPEPAIRRDKTQIELKTQQWSDTNLESFISGLPSYIAEFRGQEPVYANPVSKTDLTLGGIPAKQVLYSNGDIETYLLRPKVISAEIHAELFTVTYYNPREPYRNPEHLEIYQGIVRSLQFR